MTDMGPCSYYLGMSITRDRGNRTIRLGQQAYFEKILEDLGFADCNGTKIPMEPRPAPAIPDKYRAPKEARSWYSKAVGCLMYAMLGTRPDIAFAVSTASRLMANPTEEHAQMVKKILKYLKETKHLKLVFKGPLKPLTGLTDADWAGATATQRSTSGYIFNLGSGCISWSSERQPTMALSTCEAELDG